MFQIKNLEELISAKHGPKTIKNCVTSNLTAPGENYGSIMIKIDATIVDKNDKREEEFHAVGKLIPQDEFALKIFNTQVTYKNEIEFYTSIVPLLQNFQKEQGVEDVINFFPQCYGGRINLNDSEIVDSDAALILENLALKNYFPLDRHVGFDFETAQLLIKDLATFHAVPIALKLKRPTVFEQKIKPYLFGFAKTDDLGADFTQQLIEMYENRKECAQIMERIRKCFLAEYKMVSRQPFATVVHNDYWVNNTLIKLENGKAVDNKMVDFQTCGYESPAKDVLFFLFSSVQTVVLQNHLDDLLELYHSHFIKNLEDLKCDTEPFSYEMFEKELELEGPYQLEHVSFMSFVILGKKMKHGEEMPKGPVRMDNPTEEQMDKCLYTALEFARRNWI